MKKKGIAVAGNTYCSGVLHAAWKGDDLKYALELNTAAAACSLSQPGSAESIHSANKPAHFTMRFNVIQHFHLAEKGVILCTCPK